MWINIGAILIISYAIDLLCYQKAEDSEGIFKSICKHTVTVSLLVILSFIYLIDRFNGNYVWIAFLIGMTLFIILETVIHRDSYVNIIQGAAIIMLGAYLATMTVIFRYELQTIFYKPCWSQDGKQIAFFMQNKLIRYKLGIPFSLWSPDNIWEKYYLCTMDHNSDNFKALRQIDKYAEDISWSGNGTLVFSIGKGLWVYDFSRQKEIRLIDNIEGQIKDPWLSKDGRYLGFILYYRENRPREEEAKYGKYYDNYRLLVKDLKTNKDNIDILQKDVKFSLYNHFNGSYVKDMIIYYEKGKYSVYDLVSGNKKEYKGGEATLEQNLKEFDFRDTSPNRKMYAEPGAINEWHPNAIIVRTIDQNVLSKIIYKTKRSYLFNIFTK